MPRHRTIVADKTGLVVGELINVSQRGCGLHLTRLIICGQYVTLRLYLDGETASVYVDQAIVKWTEKDVAGVEFLFLSQDNQMRLSRVFNDQGDQHQGTK